MPELPEVEVTRRRIAPLLVDRRIRSVRTTGESYLFLTPPRNIARRMRGRVVRRLDRLGKYLVALLDDEARLVIHLGMTGQLFSSTAASVRLLSSTARASLTPETQLSFTPDAHTHLHFTFEGNGPDVYLRDVRKFGKVLLLRPGEDHERLDRLGTDALAMDARELFAATRNRKVAIKSLLLDQSVIAGVGNIYADESLHLAGIRPSRPAARVSRKESESLMEALHRVLERSIETGGSSISDYVAPDGQDGGYQDERAVYAREGDACYSCGGIIRKRTIGQRGTHYCPSCQR